MRHVFGRPYALFTLAILLFSVVPSQTRAADQKVYLASCCGAGATVSVVDAMMLMEMSSLPAQSGTTAVAIGPDNMTGYIGLPNNMVEEVDLMSGMAMMSFPAGNGAAAIAITPDGSTGYIANKADGSVSVFNTATGAVTANLSILPGGGCVDVLVSPDGSTAYAVCQLNPQSGDSQSVMAVIQKNQLARSLSLPGSKPFPGNTVLAMTPDGTRAYIAGVSTSTQTGFAAINLTKMKVTKFFPLPGMSYGLAVHPMFPNVLFSSGAGVLNYLNAKTGAVTGTVSLRSSGKGGVVPYMGGMRVAVASVDDDVVAVIDNTDGQLCGSIAVGAVPERLVVSNDEMTSLVGTTYSTAVHEFDAATGQWMMDFEGGTNPASVTLDPMGMAAYIVDKGLPNSGAGSGVMALDAMTMMGRMWSVPLAGASSSAVRPDGKRLYIASSAGSISVIKTDNAQILRTISLGAMSGSASLAASPDNKSIYAVYTQANGGNVLSVISAATNKILTTVPLGGGASSAGPFLALSPDGKTGYVTLMSQNMIAIVDLVQDQVRASIAVGSGMNPGCITIHPNGMTAYVAATNGVLVADLTTNSVAGTIPISGGVQNIALTADGSMAYVSVMQGQAAIVDTAVDSVIQYLPVDSTVGLAISH